MSLHIPGPDEWAEATVHNPRLLILFGATKVGKTTQIVEFQNWLKNNKPNMTSIILDTEKGTSPIKQKKRATHLTSLTDLKQYIAHGKKNKVDFLILDTLDVVVEWVDKLVCETHDVESIGDLAFGKGYGLVREKVMNVINHLKDCCEHLILIGHRKKTLIGTDSVEVNVSSLDLSGKLKNVVCADADAIGYMFRGDEGQLQVSFKASDDIEAGSRFEHLVDIFDFDWSKIFVNIEENNTDTPQQ